MDLGGKILVCDPIHEDRGQAPEAFYYASAEKLINVLKAAHQRSS